MITKLTAISYNAVAETRDLRGYAQWQSDLGNITMWVAVPASQPMDAKARTKEAARLLLTEALAALDKET